MSKYQSMYNIQSGGLTGNIICQLVLDEPNQEGNPIQLQNVYLLQRMYILIFHEMYIL